MGRREVVGRPPARGRGVAAGAALAGCVALIGWLSQPRGYEVAGVSMAPGLLPGDRVVTGPFPLVDSLRAPRRLDRWVIVAPDGELAIKRVVGLPGDAVALVAGDIAIDGRLAPPSPAVLAGRATALDVTALAGDADDGTEAGTAADPAACPAWRRTFPAAEMLDDAAFAPRERRLLVPVRDVGLAAIVRIEPAATPLDVRIRVGDVAVRWRLAAAGRHAFAAGRLDGHVVGGSWLLPGGVDAGALPPLPPAVWDVVLPERGGGANAADHDSNTPVLGITVEAGAAAAGPRGFSVERLWGWRDAVYRPAADGATAWRLGPDEFLLLGDHATGSRDSRHFGPLGRRALLHPVAPAAAAPAGSPAGG